MVVAGSLTTDIEPSLNPKQLILFAFIVGENGEGSTNVYVSFVIQLFASVIAQEYIPAD